MVPHLAAQFSLMPGTHFAANPYQHPP
jgi:hypothetical protein